MSNLKKCYEILEINPESTYEEAKLAFRDMVSIWHPDKFSHNSRLKEKAEEKLKLVNAAWEQLQAYFAQKEDAVAEQPPGEPDGPAKVRSAREREHQQRNGKRTWADCLFIDLDFEPLIPREQAHRAYRHRFQGGHHDPGSTVDKDTGSGHIAQESGFQRKSACEGEESERNFQRGTGGLRHDRAQGTAGRRQQHEPGTRDKKADPGMRRDNGDKEASRVKKDAQRHPDDSLDERDRKIKLLSESFRLGFLERKFVHWQHREREHRKQQVAAKEISRKNKILADLYLTRYKAWLAAENSRRRRFAIISKLFQIATSRVAGSRTGKFLLGIPDVSLTFVRGGSFLMGVDPGKNFRRMSVGNSHQPYRVVTVDDFYIGKYPVTVRQWSKAMGVETEGVEKDFPVLLTWDEVREFVLHLNDITGLKFRVPSDAEWEYAARSGGKDENWHEMVDASGVRACISPARYKVGQCRPNALGIFDMLGNSGEWVAGSCPGQTGRQADQETSRETRNNFIQVIRGEVHRDLHRNFTFSYTFHRNFPPTGKAHRYSFRLSHPAF